MGWKDVWDGFLMIEDKVDFKLQMLVEKIADVLSGMNQINK